MLKSKPFVKIFTTKIISLFLLGNTISLVSANQALAIPKIDFNSDGKSDILWRNTSTGENAIWLMNGLTESGSFIKSIPDTNWKAVGTGDFNSDGKSDILWRNTSTGENVIWLMNGLTESGSFIKSIPDTNWKAVGTGQD